MSRQGIRRSLRNSTIIINDSENESSDKEATNNSVIECSPHISRPPLQQSSSLKQKRQLNTLKPRTRSSVILLDNDSSSASSDIQTSLEKRNINGENIAPSQIEDDVVELWSCLDKSTKKNKIYKTCKNNLKIEDTFIIDRKPDLTNLEDLEINTTPELVHKKRKIQIKDQSTKYTNKYNNKKSKKKKKSNGKHKEALREIVIDGCNVAMAHTNGREFSEKGIKLMVDYFESRGHIVKVFLPQHVRRRRYQLLEEMYTDGIVVFTPSRNIEGKRITPYDDRFILEYATKCGGIVISSDQYRDLYREKPEWRDTILNRLLTPTFVGDIIMFPEDPMGRGGPNLHTFLRH
ncbi:NEDD4-binding protein 1 isoform X2 [Harpegnathos saltator]|nr:NEDD4-binding protein 1-like isoform X2 [Harpegnathos saltator]XP_025159910.1 NEDD4-binding protein 1 isoform X2 [Harpegnathos saltator]